MAQRTRAQLLADNAALFVGGTNIPAPSEKAYNDNEIDSFAMNAIVVSSNTTAVNDQSYVNVANATYTDPAPAEGKGYSVFVRNGTATVGSVAYDMSGATIKRIYHSGSWKTYVSNAAGEWTPTAATGFDSVSVIKATYQVIGGYVNFQILAEVINSSLVGTGTVTFTVPVQFPMSTASNLDCVAAITFRQNVSLAIESCYVEVASGLIQVTIISTITPGEVYELTLSGAYKLAV